MNKRSIGNFYEEEAVKFLISNDYEILERNFYTPHGELDIIVKKDCNIFAVEVKYRKSSDISVFESISKIKLEHIFNSLMYFLQDKKLEEKFNISIMALLIRKKNKYLDFIIVKDIQNHLS